MVTKDTREKGLKKHTIYYKRDLRRTANKAVEEILLIDQNKGALVPSGFTAVAHMTNNMLIIFKLGDVQRTAAPPTLTMPTQAQQLAGTVPMSPLPVVGIDGIPFLLNPKYDGSAGSGADPLVGSIGFIVIEDLVNKYQYSFETEEKVIAQNS